MKKYYIKNGKNLVNLNQETWTKDFHLKQHYCDPCWRAYSRQQKRISKHRSTLMAYYGNQCSICNRGFDAMNKRNIHVDHDHSAAYNIRGLLCLNCNSILGHARDSLDILEKAISYLKERQDRPLDDLLEEIALGEVDNADLFTWQAPSPSTASAHSSSHS